MRYEGYHSASALPFKQGQKVVIPAGVTIRSMKPGVESYVTKRAQTITVRTVMNGQSIPARTALNDRDYYEPLKAKGFDFAPIEALRDANSREYYEMLVPISNPTISWPGAGGYWCDADINELLIAQDLRAAA